MHERTERYFLPGRGCLLGFLFFLLLLICFAQGVGAFLSFFALLVELRFLIRLAIHLSKFDSFDQQVGFVGPGRFAIRIELDRIFNFFQPALDASLGRIKIFLVLPASCK